MINARFNPPSGFLGLISKNIYKVSDNEDHIYCKSDKDVKSFP